MAYSNFRCTATLLLLLGIFLEKNTAFGQGPNQYYYGPGTGLLIREEANQFLVASSIGSEYELRRIDKNTNSLLSVNSLGPKALKLVATASGDYLKLDSVADPANGLADFRLTRVQPDGAVVWSNHFGDNTGGLLLAAYGAVETTGGNWMVIGHAKHYPSSHDTSRLMLISADGQQLLLEKQFPGAFTSIAPAADGTGFFLRGWVPDIGGGAHIVVRKVDLAGDPIWTYVPPPPGFGLLYEFLPTADGGILVSEFNDDPPRVFKLNSDGQEQWSFNIGLLSTFFGVSSLVENADGGATFIFYRAIGGGGPGVVSISAYIFRVDNTGQEMWRHLFQGNCDVPGQFGIVGSIPLLSLNDLLLTSAGDYAAVGYGGDGTVCDQVVLVRTAADVVGTNQAPDLLTNARLYPNPADGRLSVQFRSTIAGTLLLQFYDGQGKLCQQRRAQVSEGENQLDLNLGNWPVGIYSVVGRVDGSQVGGAIVFPRLVVQR